MDTFPLYRWWKAHEIERIWPETILKKQERYCVSACSRFKNMNFAEDHAWVLSSEGKSVTALLIHSQSSLFPVFCGQTEFYIPAFLYRFLKNIHIHALHGLKQETETLEEILKPIGIYAKERHDYNLMSIDSIHETIGVKIPKGLVLRWAVLDDIDELTPLQEAYQKEEVLRNPNDYSRHVCRLGLKKQIEQDKTLVAVVGGKIAGKINTNAFAYNSYQIGGVYVLPEYRMLGIAGSMTTAFTRLLLQEGKGVSLFVKQSNKPAERVYKRCGFKKIADYRIVYMN